jgi:sugar phosphate isomerase/epimerase
MVGVQEPHTVKVGKAGEASDVHLCYCTNIHPGESWKEVRENLERYVIKVKNNVAPGRRFGVGLRLSAKAAGELAAPDAVSELKDFLSAEDLYVFTINGFPYGDFHGTSVKENVYRPDWLEDERISYSDLLAGLLADLLPEDATIEGSVSTVPGAYKPRVRTDSDEDTIAESLLRHVATLVRIERESGKKIGIALEPEPCCYLETIEETLTFFESRLFSRNSVDRFATLIASDVATAERSLRDKVGVCFDTCHAAVEFEDPKLAFSRLEGAGIRILKMQLSAGLRVARMSEAHSAELQAFAEDVYLHQVVARRDGKLTRTPDLPEALNEFSQRNHVGSSEEWRIHFHVPLFLEQLDGFENTQKFLREALAIQKLRPLTRHLEVETYTWHVLPKQHRSGDIVESVSRELDWVLGELGA